MNKPSTAASSHRPPSDRAFDMSKRLFDAAVSSVGFVLASPVPIEASLTTEVARRWNLGRTTPAEHRRSRFRALCVHREVPSADDVEL